ncbi:MAG: hypothetical protein V4642_12300 [Bacteroidota bacterium]
MKAKLFLKSLAGIPAIERKMQEKYGESVKVTLYNANELRCSFENAVFYELSVQEQKELAGKIADFMNEIAKTAFPEIFDYISVVTVNFAKGIFTDHVRISSDKNHSFPLLP